MAKKIFKTITTAIIITTIASCNVFAATDNHLTMILTSVGTINSVESNKIIRNYLKHKDAQESSKTMFVNNKKENQPLVEVKSQDDTLYNLLNMTEAEYIEALKSGKTLKQLLVEKNKVSQYKDLLYCNQSTILETAVKAGSISTTEKVAQLEKYKNYLESDNIFGDKVSTVVAPKYEDEVLNMLDMSDMEYRNEIKKGESLKSLLAKADKTNEFAKYQANEFSNIMKMAVSSGSVTETEALSILNKQALLA